MTATTITINENPRIRRRKGAQENTKKIQGTVCLTGENNLGNDDAKFIGTYLESLFPRHELTDLTALIYSTLLGTAVLSAWFLGDLASQASKKILNNHHLAATLSNNNLTSTFSFEHDLPTITQSSSLSANTLISTATAFKVISAFYLTYLIAQRVNAFTFNQLIKTALAPIALLFSIGTIVRLTSDDKNYSLQASALLSATYLFYLTYQIKSDLKLRACGVIFLSLAAILSAMSLCEKALPNNHLLYKYICMLFTATFGIAAALYSFLMREEKWAFSPVYRFLQIGRKNKRLFIKSLVESYGLDITPENIDRLSRGKFLIENPLTCLCNCPIYLSTLIKALFTPSAALYIWTSYILANQTGVAKILDSGFSWFKPLLFFFASKVPTLAKFQFDIGEIQLTQLIAILFNLGQCYGKIGLLISVSLYGCIDKLVSLTPGLNTPILIHRASDFLPLWFKAIFTLVFAVYTAPSCLAAIGSMFALDSGFNLLEATVISAPAAFPTNLLFQLMVFFSVCSLIRALYLKNNNEDLYLEKTFGKQENFPQIMCEKIANQNSLQFFLDTTDMKNPKDLKNAAINADDLSDDNAHAALIDSQSGQVNEKLDKVIAILESAKDNADLQKQIYTETIAARKEHLKNHNSFPLITSVTSFFSCSPSKKGYQPVPEEEEIQNPTSSHELPKVSRGCIIS